VAHVSEVHTDTKLHCLKSRDVTQRRRYVVSVVAGDVVPTGSQLTQTAQRRARARRRVRLLRIVRLRYATLRLRRVTTAQLIRRESRLRRGSPKRVRCEIGVVQQPVHIQSRIRRRVIRHKQIRCLSRRRRWRITSQQRDELSLTANVSTKERGHISQSGAA